MSLQHEEQRIAEVIDKVLEERDRMVRREIDASCCRTKWDWDKLHEQQDVYEIAYQAAIQEILQMIASARRGR